MIFGLSVLIFRHEDVIPFLPVLSDYDIKHIELRCYPPRIPFDNKEYIKKLSFNLDKYNISVHSFHLPFNHIDISSTDQELREKSCKEVLKGVEICGQLGGKLGILHPGAKYGTLSNKKTAEENSINSISQIFEHCEKREIKLAVENMLPGRVGEDYNFFDKVMKNINSPDIGICFDSSHANANGTVYSFLEKTREKLLTVHFSDNNGYSDDHFFPFKGNINWKKIIEILNRISYKSIFMLEVAEEVGHSAEENLTVYQDTIKKLLNYYNPNTLR
ncbi:MAG: sugar phosphate isomerase/epimerase [Candidatus Firestonebacteria bacterium]|nr:sugar phosphate isomerase/epimerase [Candidatus Firestonebacteria bacterium]